jgi:hypothetical protein
MTFNISRIDLNMIDVEEARDLDFHERDLRESLAEAEQSDPDMVDFWQSELDDLTEDGAYPALRSLATIAMDEGLKHGTFIADSHFKTYAQDQAEDLYGEGIRAMSTYIDWDHYATELCSDYSTYETDDGTYHLRA